MSSHDGAGTAALPRADAAEGASSGREGAALAGEAEELGAGCGSASCARRVRTVGRRWTRAMTRGRAAGNAAVRACAPLEEEGVARGAPARCESRGDGLGGAAEGDGVSCGFDTFDAAVERTLVRG